MTFADPATCASPLRWAGGKRRLLPLLGRLIPQSIDRLIEPFFGGGSVSLGVAAKSAIGADTNEELVNFFLQSAADPAAVLAVVGRLSDDRDTYNRVREWAPATDIERAGRFAFLNRTAYFGLYRTNQQGRYNVPYGGGGRLNIAAFTDRLHELERVMKRVSVEHTDYLTVLARVEADDVVFLDPPYGTRGDFPFRRYGSLLFSPSDHRRLAAEAERCRTLGAKIFLTLPPDEALLGAYEGWHVVGERRRGERLAELCLATDPVAVEHPATTGEWSQPTQNRVVEDPRVYLRTGTD